MTTAYSNLASIESQMGHLARAYDAVSKAGVLLAARYRDRGATGADEDARVWLSQNTFIFERQVTTAWTLAHQP